MPGLLLDDGAFQPLAVPSRTTIGRGASNHIQPDSQSISKNHGAIEISNKRGRVITTIEDFDSRNGTFTGPDTLEMERVKGKREIEYGFYIRFGNAGKYYRYLEEPPKDAIVLEPESPAPATTRSDKTPARQSLAIDVPAAEVPVENRLVRSMPEFQSPAYDGQLQMPLQMQMQQPWQQHQQQPQQLMHHLPPEEKNVTISIQYPTGGRQPLQPVTISIDPQQQQRGHGMPPLMYQPQPPANINRFIEDLPPTLAGAPSPSHSGYPPMSEYGRDDRNPPAHYHNQFQQGRYTPTNMRSNEWAEGSVRGNSSKLPPPLGVPSHDAWEPTEPPPAAAVVNYPQLHPEGPIRDSKTGANLRASIPEREIDRESSLNAAALRKSGSLFPPPLPGSPVRGVGHGREPIVSAFHGSKPVPDKPLAKLVRRMWLPIDDLPMTTLTDSLLMALLGAPDPSIPRGTATAPLPTITGKIPDYLMAEATADRFFDPEMTVVGHVGGVISDLNDFFKQAVVGATLIENDGSASAALDVALMAVISNILNDSICTLRSVNQGSFVQAFQDAASEGCDNTVYETLQRSISRLEKLMAFVNNEFCREQCQGMTTAEMYCIASVALDYILNDLDSTNAIIWSVAAKTDLPSQQAKLGAAIGATKSTPGSPRASTDGLAMKNALSNELDELRRLKGKSAVKGASSAIAAQIALLEKEKMALNIMSGGGKGPITKAQKELARLQMQEMAGPMRDQKLLQLLRIWDDNHMRIQFHGLSRWRSVVEALKSNFSSKMKRFARLLLVRREKLIARAFRKWDKQTAAKRTEFLIEQQTAVLKYEMCGMEARIHELSSGNALATSLAAERALNKELAGTNMELRLGVQELDEKFLEIANAPPAQRKKLVREVFYGREDDIAQARREARLLREELQRLYELGIETSTANKASERILPKAPVPPEYREKVEKSAPVQLRDRATHAQLGPRDGSPPRSISPHDRSAARPPPLALRQADHGKAAASGQRPVPTMKIEGYPAPSPAAKVLTRQDATLVIAQEVRRLSTSITQLQEEREELRIKATTDSYMNSQQALALQALQRRITDRERSQAALRVLLKQRLGDKGLMELTVALEEVGVGNSALLKEVPVEKDKERDSFLPGILEHRNRGDKLAAIDAGLDYAPSDSEESGAE